MRISSRLYAALALSSLAVLYAGYVYLGTRSRGPYAWLLPPLQRMSDHFMVPVLAFVLGLLVTLVPIVAVAVPLRRRLVGRSVDPAAPRPGEGPAAYLARGRAVAARSPRDAERREHFAFHGRMSVLIGATLTAIVAGAWLVTGVLMLMLLLVGVLAVFGGALQIVTRGPMRLWIRRR